MALRTTFPLNQPTETITDNRYIILTVFFFLLKFGLQYLFLHPAFELQRDEYLYLDQANHLDWGFMEVPPIISILALLTKWLGNGIFWVKFWPALFGALTVLVMSKIVKALGGNLFALALASVSFVFSAYLRLNLLFQPNSLDVLIWTLLFYILIRYVKTNQGKYLLFFGLFTAIGFLNKYTVGFFVLGTVGALLFTPQRKIFLQKEFYYAALITAFLILPNIYWQYQHQFPFFQHMQELKRTQLEHVKLSDFLLDQVIMCLGAILVWPVGLGALIFTRWGKPYRLISFIFFLVLGLFIMFQGKSYYTLGLYPVLMAAGSVFWESVTQSGRQYWLRPLFLVLPVGLLIPVIPILFPILSPQSTATYALRFKELGILRWEDGQEHALPQDFADMLGWRELTEKVSLAYQQLPAEKRQHTIILCDNYGQAGAINYYGANALPRALSEEASYLLWLPQSLAFRNVILVGDIPSAEDQQQFKKIRLIGKISNPYAREKGTSILVLEDASAFIVAKVNQRIARKKAKF